MELPERTCYAGEVNTAMTGKRVVLYGWVRRTRNLGSLIFIDLRDRTGIVQLVFQDEINSSAFEMAKELRPEFVIYAEGIVRPRSEEAINKNLPTGYVEVAVDTVKTLNESVTPPFQVEDDALVSDDMRLRYRYLDLRRPANTERMILRHKILQVVRQYLSKKGFIEIETPFLTKSTPEGARDFLVPSRMHKSKFYALPQSPQLFKQLCMISGFDKYFQIVRCFRDEDLRSDRQLEFTQIDIEMSFPTRERIMSLSEEMMGEIFGAGNIQFQSNIEHLSYNEAMERFGCDKPDNRFGLELKDVSFLLSESSFPPFIEAGESGGIAKAICIPESGKFSRKDIQNLTETVKPFGFGGMAYVKWDGDKMGGSLAKYISEETALKILNLFNEGKKAMVLILAGKYIKVCSALSAVRLEVAKKINLIDIGKHSLIWIYDFPLFEYSEEEGRWVSRHHPFTMPFEDDLSLLETEPDKVRAHAYDIVLDGNEIGGGSLRIHDVNVQKNVFSALKISEKEAEEKFGFLLEALRYGAPPHGGIAFGFDRIVAIVAGVDSIRDIIAFPKTTSGLCLMSSAPSEVDSKQLSELGLKGGSDEK